MKKLISFSLYGDSNRYLRGAIRNTEMRQEFYPDWTCRFYVADDVPRKAVEQLKSNGAEIVPCSGDNPLPPMFWRFLAAVDKDVDVCIVRDADSRPGARERRMVDEWLASGKAFHIIRDHPHHKAPIMGGLWGRAGNRILRLRDALRKRGVLYGKEYRADQRFLWDEVYPLIKDDVLIHSRFVKFPGEHPVPPPEWKEPLPHAVGVPIYYTVEEFFEDFFCKSQEELPIATLPFPLRSPAMYFVLPERIRCCVTSVYRDLKRRKAKRKNYRERERIPPRTAGRGVRAPPVSTAKADKNPASKMIAFSLPHASPKHIRGAIKNVEMSKELYPDWACRFYVPPEIPGDWVASLRGCGAEVIVVDDNRGFGNHPCCWSFSVAAEKGIEAVLVRDVLSRPLARERQMVGEWLASGKAFHIIRDAPVKKQPIPNNTWGFRGDCISRLYEVTRDRGERYKHGDQFLYHEIYPRIKDDVLIHSRLIQFPGEKLVTPPPWKEPPPYATGVPIVYSERLYLERGDPTPTMYPFPRRTRRGVSFFRRVKK